MINFISLSIRNFMSYGNEPTHINLQREGATLIVGEDKENTSSGTGSNGVGKSTIIQALLYSVYGKPLSNISLDNLVNNVNKKNMEVVVIFEKNNTFYKIKRVRREKGASSGAYVKFYVKEGSMDFKKTDDKTRDSMQNTNAAIEKVMGMPYELFCRIIVFSALHQPFLDLPVRHTTQPCQTRIIEELFNITTISQKATVLKQAMRENEAKKNLAVAKADIQEREWKRHKEQLQKAKRHIDEWEEERKKHITRLSEKLERLEGKNVDFEKSMHDKLKEIDKQINTSNIDLKSMAGNIRTLSREIKKKESEIEHLKDDQCPYCLQKYPDASVKIHEIDAEIKEKRSKKEGYEAVAKELEAEKTNLIQRKKEVEGEITVLDIDELLEIQRQYEPIKGRIEELKKEKNPYLITLQELEETKLEPVNRDEINEIDDLIKHQEFLYKLLTKNDSFVRKTLLNKNIPYLNAKLQHYLTELGLHHIVEFTHDLTAKITQFGRPLDFGNLSNGQRARVNIALSLAFRDVLQKLHSKVNICILDEVLDVGLDNIGVQAAGRMLERKAVVEKLSMFVISHRDEVDKIFPNILRIQFSNGFSSIVDS